MRAHWSALTDAFYAGVVLSLLSMLVVGFRYDCHESQQHLQKSASSVFSFIQCMASF